MKKESLTTAGDRQPTAELTLFRAGVGIGLSFVPELPAKRAKADVRECKSDSPWATGKRKSAACTSMRNRKRLSNTLRYQVAAT